jgi:membrane-bound lytic murein transglycosylase D
LTRITLLLASLLLAPLAAVAQTPTLSNEQAPVATAAESQSTPDLKTSSQLTQPTSVAPVTPVASEAVPVESVVVAELPPQDLWDRVRAGYAVPDLDDQLVRKWESFYAGKPDYLARIVDRGSRYLFYIATEVERRGMPSEIVLLPMIESAFNPIANSTASAVGIWQFIPSTGKDFGMKQDFWADSRRDVVAATKGALDYLQKLHGMFGDWQLALAAYNWGEGSVGRAIARNKAAGLPTGYSDLRNMPDETRNYYPKLQAVKNIIGNPGAFNVKLTSVPNRPYFKSITIARHIDVKHAVALAEISSEEFIALNPAHNRPVIGGREEHHILLPADKADLFLSRLETSDRPQVSWMAYKTKANDKLDVLARQFNTTIDGLRAVNGIRGSGLALPVGYNLLVPSNGDSDSALGSLQNAVFTKLPDVQTTVAGRAHRVRNGETLGGIARKYGTNVAKLKQINRLKGDRVRIGQVLNVSGSKAVAKGRVVKAKGKRAVLKSKAKAKAKPKRR